MGGGWAAKFSWVGETQPCFPSSATPETPSSLYSYGAVAYVYQIGKYEVTIQQYTDFLNAIAASDPYGLYNVSMGTSLNIAGIQRAGSSGSYNYSVVNNAGSSGNRPITFVSWFDAARFANWMANGQQAGTPEAVASLEDGAYTLNGAIDGIAPARNVINPETGAAPGFFLPLEDEWYKAAYYSPSKNGGGPGYYTYAMQTDVVMGNSHFSAEGQANLYVGAFSTSQSNVYSDAQNYLTDVGAFFNSESYYGTYDQNGNVYQWNDLNGAANASRGVAGGFWFGGPVSASNTTLASQAAAYEGNDTGFRLAAPIPEPGVLTLAACGLAGWAVIRRRRGQVQGLMSKVGIFLTRRRQDAKGQRSFKSNFWHRKSYLWNSCSSV